MPLPDSKAYFTFVVAGPLSNIDQDVQQFSKMLLITLTVLGIGLLGAVFLQIRFGLRPLRQLKIALTETRAGRAARLPESFPIEIQPVVSELNALLDHNTALLKRARTQTANLAHALKNPLTVLNNEAREIQGERRQILRDQINSMTDSVNRYLRKPEQPALAVCCELVFRWHRWPKTYGFPWTISIKKKLQIHFSGLEDCYLQGDRHDLEEMLGNLLVNACKWAQKRVKVHGERNNGN